MAAPDAADGAGAASPAATVRRLIRAADTAALGVLHPDGGRPYISLVLVACDHDASPLLLISALAEHTRAIRADARVSLLFDGTAGLDSRLTGARATVLGTCAVDEAARGRFLARHPDAAAYAGFADFACHRVAIERAHLVAGFGRIHWVDGTEVLRPLPAGSELAAHEAGIVRHMNDDHADAVALYARVLLGLDGDGWRMTGCDAEGIDLRLGGRVARLDFARPVADAEAARRELVRLVREARSAS